MDIISWFSGQSLYFKVNLLSFELNTPGSTLSACVITTITWSHLIWPSSHPGPLFQPQLHHTGRIISHSLLSPYLRPRLNESVPLWWVCGRWCVDLASPPPPPVHGPGAPIRAQHGESDSGALAFQKRAGENEPWRKSEVIIFIISQGSNCGNGDLWGGGERERERGRCTSCSSSLLIGPYKLQW